MNPDDPRHGTVAGYNRIPCRDNCCKQAMANYKKRWEWDRHNGRHRITSTLGTRRRIESLAWLGWSRHEIALRAGMHATNMTRLLRGDTMTVALAAKFATIYDELHMTLPTGNAQAIANVRNRARSRGAVSPFAWDNPDTDERPRGITHEGPTDRADRVAVERILSGDWRLSCAPADKAVVCETWVRQGRSLTDLARLTGWNPARYYRIGDAA